MRRDLTFARRQTRNALSRIRLAPVVALGFVEGAAAWQQQYLTRLRQQAALDRLKLERNSTQGLFLEAPVNTPAPAEWTRRGGLQKVERYTTAELERYAIQLAEAEAVVASEIRAQLSALREAAASVAADVRDLGRHLAATDALLALATVAAERGWVQPQVNEGETIKIIGGRYPVMEQPGPFQPNDACLEASAARDQMIVLTGPNMAGKSTWMRQIALIVLLAQMGSWVPATAAQIGLVDAIFTRIGAVDDLDFGWAGTPASDAGAVWLAECMRTRLSRNRPVLLTAHLPPAGLAERVDPNVRTVFAEWAWATVALTKDRACTPACTASSIRARTAPRPTSGMPAVEHNVSPETARLPRRQLTSSLEAAGARRMPPAPPAPPPFRRIRRAVLPAA